MMKMKGTLQMCALAALVAVGAQTAQATEVEPDRAAGHELRITNDFQGVVNVFVKDAHGRRYDLGRVARDAKTTFQVPAEVAAAGPFRIEVIPMAPAWSPWSTTAGIRTREITLPDGAPISLRLAAELKNATVEVSAN